MVKNNIVIENARLVFRNFGGAAGKFNPEGRRNFCVILDQKMGEKLAKDGWNIRYLQPKEEGDEATPYLQVAVSYTNQPPKVILISGKGKTLLDEGSVGLLDWAEIGQVDLIINPYNWNAQGNSGVKAYLKSLYVTIIEDEFEAKYTDVPDSGGAGTIGGCGNCDTCDGNCGCNGH